MTLNKKMYTNIPIVETENLLVDLPESSDNDKRIKRLEDRVRHLSEQLHRVTAAIELNTKQIRRQNTDIHNVNTVLRNR
jgi:hypothetical protein